ncbi:PqqD family protein [Micromonospora sp. DT62]|uniref:PqqD family protein n=1 Tax=Micromonospora sp. DT62 TaxID=3416521 RepID=UPI003CEB6F30
MTTYQRDLRARVRRVGGLLYLALDDQDIVLEGVAEFIWHRLGYRATVETLIEAVADEYDVAGSDVAADVAEVVDDLVATGFVQARGER